MPNNESRNGCHTNMVWQAQKRGLCVQREVVDAVKKCTDKRNALVHINAKKDHRSGMEQRNAHVVYPHVGGVAVKVSVRTILFPEAVATAHTAGPAIRRI